MIALTGTALVVHIVFPLAPPRMFPQWGFVDTMAAFGPNAYAGASGDLVNQFAAMPSLHVGWAALIAYVVHRTGPRWLAAVAAAHVVVTVLVVVVTANHYWLDGIVALALLAVATRVVRPPERRTGSPAARGSRSALASTRAAGAVSRQASKVSSASSSRSIASRWTTTQPKP